MFGQIRKRLSNTPTKLPNAQIKSQLKHCKTLISINNLLRYCAYENEDAFIPTQAMVDVMTKRLLSLLLSSAVSKKQAWLLQIQNHVHYIKPHLTTSSRGKWHLAFVLITLENRITFSKEDCDAEDMMKSSQKFMSSDIRIEYSESKGNDF